jgi:predicted dinucleotide-binding enzyme
MNIAILGVGSVGGALADQLERAGHQVTIAARNPNSDSVAKALARNPRLKVSSPVEAVEAAQVTLLATPFQANEQALAEVEDALTGKVLIDCTNPVGPGLTHGLDNRQSGSAFVQDLLPAAHVVKAFTIYGYENFEDNSFPAANVKPAMLYCGNNLRAKGIVSGLITDLGWDPVDVGNLDQALHLEHMTLLWVRMVRINKASPHFVWARLTK